MPRVVLARGLPRFPRVCEDNEGYLGDDRVITLAILPK